MNKLLHYLTNFFVVVTLLVPFGYVLPGSLAGINHGYAAGASAAVTPPAFPGAEGFGANSIGGRGGTTIEVVNLNDSGTGSLRACVEASGPRTCVFRTGGLIVLQSTLDVTNPYITIAGQTAPGGGITLKTNGSGGDTLDISTHDVVVRYLTFRPGPGGENHGSQIASNGVALYNIMIDHDTFSWGVDSDIETWYRVYNSSIQWSIISEGLNCSTHSKGCHSKGLMIGGYAGSESYNTQGSENISVLHNLMAHNVDRNPLMQLCGIAQVINNVTYDPQVTFSHQQNNCPGYTSYINWIGNYHKKGPSSDSDTDLKVIPADSGVMYSGKVYVQGNIGPSRPDNSQPDSNWVDSGSRSFIVTTPAPAPVVTTTDAQTAYNDVLAGAGNNQSLACDGTWVNRRDTIDARIVNDVKNGTGSIIDDPSQVGGWITPAAGTPCVDSDHDGMPDGWEIQNGLNPNDPTDANQDANGNGYTNLEDYLNGTVAPSTTATISGNAGVAGAALAYTDGTPKAVMADQSGNYLLTVPLNWSGTVTPVLPCYTFNPSSYTYGNLTGNQPSQNFTATYISGCTNVNVSIGGVSQGVYTLLQGASARQSYAGVNNGPVKISSSTGMPIIASQRVAYFNGNAWTSFAESLGLPANQLTTSYVMPWYNNADLNSQLRFGNVGSASTTVTVKVGGVVAGTYPLAPSQSARVSYAGLNNGPVQISSSGGVPIITSERVAYTPDGGTTWPAFSELMGLPAGQLTTSYVMPVYDNVNLNTQLRFGNLGSANTTVTVKVGGVVKGTYPLAPSQSMRVSYTGLNGGPVQISSSGGVKIIASERVAYFDGTVWTSFAEMMGLPGGRATTSYLVPWYNDADLDTQLRFGNVGSASTTVTVTIGGVVQGTYALAPNQTSQVSYVGVNSGPVLISSSGGVKIVAAERVAYNNGSAWSSFAEMMGLPSSQLTTSYVMPWYNDADLNTQLRFAVP